MITLITILGLVMALFVTPALAAPNTSVVFIIGSTTYTVNGQAQTMDAGPYIDSNGRTMVPVRYLAQALGASVNWNPASQTVTLTDAWTTEQRVIGSTTLTVNGQAQTMNTATGVSQ